MYRCDLCKELKNMLSIFFHEYKSDWHVRPFQTQLSVQHHLRYSNQTYFEWQ